jgi:hypothetical protein
LQRSSQHGSGSEKLLPARLWLLCFALLQELQHLIASLLRGTLAAQLAAQASMPWTVEVLLLLCLLSC